MNKKIVLVIGVSLFLAGCAGTSAVIKPVEDKQVENLKASDTAKPIQFTKVVVKLKRGEHVGAMQVGLLCVPQGDLNWKGGRITVDSDEFTEAFKEELEKYSFKTVGDTNALFEDPSTWKSEILVAGLIKELKANVCYPMAGFGNFNSSKGEAFIKVDWQITPGSARPRAPRPRRWVAPWRRCRPLPAPAQPPPPTLRRPLAICPPQRPPPLPPRRRWPPPAAALM